MTPRGRLDITFYALFKGICLCLAELFGIGLSETPEDNDENALSCLSVRTGFDLILRSLNLEPGSALLMTNINIPDMFSIVASHQLVTIPLPVDKHTLGISVAQLEVSITPGTKALLITHLFGAIMDIDAVVEIAKLHNLIVIEDCAQAFNGVYKGHPQTDVVMFSFGLIKTNTSVTGALLLFNNQKLHNKVKMLNDQLPMQHTQIYLKKVIKAFAIQVITLKLLYTILCNYCRVASKDIDIVLAGFTRGFPGADVMSKIRFRPCMANLQLMRMRNFNFSADRITMRTKVAKSIIQMIPDSMKIGCLNAGHTYWVLPMDSENPEELIKNLRKKGIDATAKASSLVRCGIVGPSTEDELVLDNLVYLPVALEVVNKLPGL